MDQVFLELIGKPQLNPAKIITIVAENFPFLEDQAKFLKATLAIPTVKQLPLDNVTKRLIQIGGPVHYEIKDQVGKENWAIDQYDDILDNICDKMSDDVHQGRSLLFINDASRLHLCSQSRLEAKKFIKLVDKWKRVNGHFVVVLYQNSCPGAADTLLRDLEYMSDAVVRTKSYKNCYFQAAWFQTTPTHKTLIPARVETNYHTCKIGKSYWSSDLLCFYERRKVPKDYDPDHDIQINTSDDEDNSNADEDDEPNRPLAKLNLDSDEVDISSTLPYTRAQNPEQSKIFYYPDKEDDIDEDDPDNDLGI